MPASQVFSALSPEAVAGALGLLPLLPPPAGRPACCCRCVRHLACRRCCQQKAGRSRRCVVGRSALRPPRSSALLLWPAAAASLGQVYRGVLRSTGEAVAVKVQRPGVAASIALDVYVLRQVGASVRVLHTAREVPVLVGRIVGCGEARRLP